jgi:hypothetical protein
MKKLIAICVIFTCLLTPLRGYSDNGFSSGPIYAELKSESDYSDIYKFITSFFCISGILLAITGGDTAPTITGIIVAIVSGICFWMTPSDDLLKAKERENIWLNGALSFCCSNDQLSPGQAFAKYHGYLLVIDSFLAKYPKEQQFRDDIKTVFEISQKDGKLTPKEKQEIVNEFTSKYKFLISGG